MLSQKGIVTISGQIARHSEPVFWGTITIDRETGLIIKVERGFNECADYLFGPQCIIFAAFGDIHIHAREDATGKQLYKEDYTTVSAAALNGGVTCVGAMPNTPEPLVGQVQLDWHRGRVEELNLPVVIFNYIGVDKETTPIGEWGDHPYKVFFGKSVGSLTVTYAAELDQILSQYRGHYVSFHVEYEPIVQMSKDGRTHSDRRPVECVSEGLRLLLPLIEKHNIKAKLCHWSTGPGSFELIKEYRDRGCQIEVEVSPLHLFFCREMAEADPSLWSLIQMNPAIQGQEHQRALIRGLKDGFIQYLATDHAPHTEEEKFKPFARFNNQFPGKSNKEIAQAIRAEDSALFADLCVEDNTSGAPWLDTYAPICGWLMEEYGFTPADIARVASYNPGRFASMFLEQQYRGRDFGKGLGDIAEGYVGNLTVLNTQSPTLVQRERLRTKVGWSPLEGYRLPGSVEAVFVGGVRQ